MNTNTTRTNSYNGNEIEALERLLGERDPHMTVAELLAEARKIDRDYWMNEAIIDNDVAGALADQIAQMEGLTPRTDEFASRVIALCDETRERLYGEEAQRELQERREWTKTAWSVADSFTGKEHKAALMRLGIGGYDEPRPLDEIAEETCLALDELQLLDEQINAKLRHPSRSAKLKEYIEN